MGHFEDVREGMYPDNRSKGAPTKISPIPVIGPGAADWEEYTNVYKPQHYKIFPDEEVIDLIRKCLTEEEFKGYCKGNILKYRLRDKHNNEEDFAKSKQYKDYLKGVYLQDT
jgi:hypothetical protein